MGEHRLSSLEIEKLLAEEREELEELEKIVEEVMPSLENITMEEINNPVILKAKLAKLNKKHRDIIYSLFRIATTSGPEGSFIVLTPQKVRSIINQY